MCHPLAIIGSTVCLCNHPMPPVRMWAGLIKLMRAYSSHCSVQPSLPLSIYVRMSEIDILPHQSQNKQSMTSNQLSPDRPLWGLADGFACRVQSSLLAPRLIFVRAAWTFRWSRRMIKTPHLENILQEKINTPAFKHNLMHSYWDSFLLWLVKYYRLNVQNVCKKS